MIVLQGSIRMWTFHPAVKEVVAHVKLEGVFMFNLHITCTYKEGITIVGALNKGDKHGSKDAPLS